MTSTRLLDRLPLRRCYEAREAYREAGSKGMVHPSGERSQARYEGRVRRGLEAMARCLCLAGVSRTTLHDVFLYLSDRIKMAELRVAGEDVSSQRGWMARHYQDRVAFRYLHRVGGRV